MSAGWCQCNHNDFALAEHVEEGHCDVCGEVVMVDFIGAVEAQLEDLDRKKKVEVLRVVLANYDNTGADLNDLVAWAKT